MSHQHVKCFDLPHCVTISDNDLAEIWGKSDTETIRQARIAIGVICSEIRWAIEYCETNELTGLLNPEKIISILERNDDEFQYTTIAYREIERGIATSALGQNEIQHYDDDEELCPLPKPSAMTIFQNIINTLITALIQE